MADWRQVQARIRKAKAATDPVEKLAELYERTRDAMVAFELAHWHEKAGENAEAAKWYTTAAEHFRRAQWRVKAEEALARLGAPIPPPLATTESNGPAPLSAAPGEISSFVSEAESPEQESAAPRPSAYSAPLKFPRFSEAQPRSEISPEPLVSETDAASPGQPLPAGKKHRRRGRRGGRGRRRGDAASATTATHAASSAPSAPQQTEYPPSHVGIHRVPSAAAPSAQPPDVEAESPAHGYSREPFPYAAPPPAAAPSGAAFPTPSRGRAGEPALASRIAQLESQLRRLLACPLASLEDADQAPAGPGVLLLSDSDQVTHYYIEACQTLRIGIGNLLRGGRGGKSSAQLKEAMADNLGIGESRVSKYLKDHCAVRWLQLDEGAPQLAHFAIAVLHPVVSD